jgi:membrane fusion protein (multidrug efflux system)
VPLEALDSIRLGSQVDFAVPGYEGREFAGRVERISPTVDPATRQLPITVSLPNPGGALIGGLYAEGRLALRTSRGLVVPLGALDLRGTAPRITVLRQGRTVVVTPVLGLRDEVLELVEVIEGLVAGDTVLLGSARSIPAGTAARVGQDR